MKTAGIIAEYNPFHRGHAYQIAQTRAAGATHVAVVLGGNFLQRGEPALFHKDIRALAALRSGADLVLELPQPYAAATAERFAYGGVFLLGALGCVDMLSFGAEDSLELLEEGVRALGARRFGIELRSRLSGGASFAAVRQEAVRRTAGEECAGAFQKPNNILGMEYIKAANRIGFLPEFLAVKRAGAPHDSGRPEGGFASASALRGILREEDGPSKAQPYLPEGVAELYREEILAGRAAEPELLERAVLSRLRSLTLKEIAALPGISEGLENRVYQSVRRASTLEELYGMIKSKRYAHSRIRRIAACGFLGVTERVQTKDPPYIRVLGFNGRGREILSAARDTASLPVSSSLARLRELGGAAEEFALLEAAAGDQYELALGRPGPCGREYTQKPVILP